MQQWAIRTMTRLAVVPAKLGGDHAFPFAVFVDLLP